MGQLALVIPFLKKLYKVTIAGSTLLEAFEESVANYGDEENESRFLQVSGKQECIERETINTRNGFDFA